MKRNSSEPLTRTSGCKSSGQLGASLPSAFGSSRTPANSANLASDPNHTSRREQNRALMPKVAAFIDEMREHFRFVKVLYAEENGIKKGKQPWRE